MEYSRDVADDSKYNTQEEINIASTVNSDSNWLKIKVKKMYATMKDEI